MEKMWAGRFSAQLDKRADAFNSSIRIDSLMYKEDIEGSIAHAYMLGEKGIIEKKDADKIIQGLREILAELENQTLCMDADADDIHMFVEKELTKRLGDVGKKLHTARSRNDQVATDIKLYVKKKIVQIKDKIKEIIHVIVQLAKQHADTIMSGYTHLQRAQPVTLAHHLLAYASMFERDYDRLMDVNKRLDISPLGSCALAGTTYPIDSQMTAEMLGFSRVAINSIDAVSDRDYCIELASCIAIIMMHLSRLAEEIILWSSHEFKYIELDDSFSTGSSIMPQKKNPDIAELTRGKTGRTYGNLIALLTMMKALPLAYNKDMQEDKEALFDSIETVKDCLNVFTPMLSTIKVKEQNMQKAAEKGFINATDCADYLVKKGLPFRTAYKVVGELVAYCIKSNKTLNTLTIEEYKAKHNLFEKDIYSAIDLKVIINRRISFGSPSKQGVEMQLSHFECFLGEGDD